MAFLERSNVAIIRDTMLNLNTWPRELVRAASALAIDSRTEHVIWRLNVVGERGSSWIANHNENLTAWVQDGEITITDLS